MIPENIKQQGREIVIPDGGCIFSPGDESSAFFIVINGTVRVEQTNSAGRTIVLYRVYKGDNCVLTTASLLSGKPYSGFGYAEGEVTAIAIPSTKFRVLLASDTAFQTLVFENFANRINELTAVIDELLIHRTDLRLARWLCQHQVDDIHQKQQDVAQELGTAREVVSRILKSFEKEGWIKISRGSLTILNRLALKQYADDIVV